MIFKANAVNTIETTSEELNKMIGARLKFFRLSREMSQTKLGREAGVTFQQIQKYENGSNRVSVSRLIEFSRILNFSMSEFFDGICEDRSDVPNLPNELVEALASPQVVELNRSFAEVKSFHMRRTVIQLVKGIGAIQNSDQY